MAEENRKVIYAADDEENIRTLIDTYLTQAGVDVRTFSDGDSLFAQFQKQRCDLVVLDIMMPGTDGLTICRKIRGLSKVPIVILTARESELDYITGLSMGGDDYIIKPFRPSIFVMRVRALLRRVDMERQSQKGEKPLSFGDVTLDENSQLVLVNGRDAGLTITERALIRYLIENCDRALSREKLLRDVWGIGPDIETRVADETVRRVRKKLSAAGSRVRINAIWGYGYRLGEGDT